MQTVGIRQEGPLMYISEQQLATLKLNAHEKSIRRRKYYPIRSC